MTARLAGLFLPFRPGANASTERSWDRTDEFLARTAACQDCPADAIDSQRVGEMLFAEPAIVSSFVDAFRIVDSVPFVSVHAYPSPPPLIPKKGMNVSPIYWTNTLA